MAARCQYTMSHMVSAKTMYVEREYTRNQLQTFLVENIFHDDSVIRGRVWQSVAYILKTKIISFSIEKKNYKLS